MRHVAVAGALAAALVMLFYTADAQAYGEGEEGFPNYSERLIHALANQARVEPATALEGCSSCGEAECYEPEPPLYYKRELNNAARFHADEMTAQGYFEHRSQCTVVENIADIYPDSCDGSASCACVGGVSECRDSCTGHQQRVRLFGSDYRRGEIIASGSGSSAFFLWLHERSPDPDCRFTLVNGHRWVLLKSGPGVGFGSSGSFSVGEFGASDETHPIPSGIHQAGLGGPGFLANWHDDAAPSTAMVNVSGECTPLALDRGLPENGAYTASFEGASGCRRYYFVFRNGSDEVFTYPTSGSLGVGGTEAECPVWSTERPPMGEACDCRPSCEGAPCDGSDGCGGLCRGSCDGGDPSGMTPSGGSTIPSDDGGTSDTHRDGSLGAAPAMDRAVHGGCGCALGGGRPLAPGIALWLGLALVFAGRRLQ